MPAPNYPAASDGEREALLNFIRATPIAFGSWRDLKGLYKRVEADPNADPEVLGAFAARLDAAPLSAPHTGQVGIELSDVRVIVDTAVGDSIIAALAGSQSGYSQQLVVYGRTGDYLKPSPLTSLRMQAAQRIALAGNLAIVTTDDFPSRDGKLNLFDLSDPTNPQRRGEILTFGSGPVAIRGPFVFVTVRKANRGSNNFTGVRVVSIADPDNPRIVAEHEIPNPESLALSPDGALLAVVVEGSGFQWNRLPSPGGVHVLDVSVPTRPQLIAEVRERKAKIAHFADRLLVVGTQDGYQGSVQIFDFAIPAKWRTIGKWTERYNYAPVAVASSGGCLYVLTGYYGIAVLDIRDPGQPKEIDRLSSGYAYNVDARSFVADSGTLYSREGNRIIAFNLSNPAKPARIGVPPTRDTMGYMKRRARRHLRNLAKTAPERFAEAVFHTLRQATGEALNPGVHWVTMDLLFGGGTRYYQQSHGRGRYSVRRGASTLVLRRREERGAVAWDTRPDLVSRLLQTPGLPWQTYEFAARFFRGRNETVPLPTDSAVLTRWLEGESLLLRTLAARSVTVRLAAGQSVTPKAVALAYFYGNRTRRERLREAIIAAAAVRKPQWGTSVGDFLGQWAGKNGLRGAELNGRGRAAALFLADRYAASVTPAEIQALSVALLRSGDARLTRLVETVAQRVPIASLQAWLMTLEPLTEAEREPAVRGLEAAAQGKDVSGLTYLAGWSGRAAIHQMVWRLLAASNTPKEAIAALWNQILGMPDASDALRSAMQSAAALSLLERAGITTEQFAARLEERPFLAALISPETFLRLLDSTPTATALQMAAAMPDDRWNAVRSGWLRRLYGGIGLLGLWTALPGAIDMDSTGRLTARFLDDPKFSDLLLSLDGEHAHALVEIRNDAFDGILSRWMAGHAQAFIKDSPALLLAATHNLPSVRDWAIRRARSLGFGLPFALRLLESEVPASVALGREFFAAVPGGDDRAFDYALALCDSPALSVRRFGREYVNGRWSSLPRADLYRALFENSDPEVQAWVATLLRDEPTAPPETVVFHSEVLRRRNKARPAKEAVKSRQSKEQTVDTATLLEMARGVGTPRDAEWALGQLARRALAGEEIPGFTLDGVAG